MSNPQGPQHQQYYSRRASQEREAAERSEDATAKRIHLDLAHRYSAMVGDDGESSETNTGSN